MNTNQKIPGSGSGMPILVICSLAFAALWCLFFGKDKETKPETAPTDAGTENRVIPSVAPTVSAPLPPISAPVPLISVPVPPLSVPPTKDVAPAPPQLPLKKRKNIKREDMVTVFQHSARALTREEAVAALTGRGFGKTAAYGALSANGRFSSWLQFAPDGTITWKG